MRYYTIAATTVERKPFNETTPHLKDFVAFLDVLNKESDRGAVLVSVAMLDDILEKTILAFLLNKAETPKLLTGFNAPLGTFSARVIAAYSLGLISEREYRECERLRKVRNEFAHNVHQSFNDQKVKDICANLDFSAKGPVDAPVGTKGQYTTAASALILMLTNRPHYVALRRLTFGEWTI
jgi:DNA-binding MltR family transcriptional regulator